MDFVENRIKIKGVEITPLKQIIDERGGVFHVIKKSHPNFNIFGEVYISKVNYKYVKAWKFHKEMTQNFCVPYGFLKLVIYDNRKESDTYDIFNEFFLDPVSNYKLITIPKQLWYGFQCLQPDYCLLLNIASHEHDPSESLVLGVNNRIINYDWNK